MNNLGEAIFHLADGQAALEKRLWQRIGQQLERHCEQLGHPEQLRDLCAGAALPSKENFMTRLMQRADRDAGYTTLPNPFCGARP
ncbi:Ferric iron reductase FhuF-like transporter [compost metagenome]